MLFLDMFTFSEVEPGYYTDYFYFFLILCEQHFFNDTYVLYF